MLRMKRDRCMLSIFRSLKSLNASSLLIGIGGIPEMDAAWSEGRLFGKSVNVRVAVRDGVMADSIAGNRSFSSKNYVILGVEANRSRTRIAHRDLGKSHNIACIRPSICTSSVLNGRSGSRGIVKKQSNVSRAGNFHENLKVAAPDRFLDSLRPTFKALLVDAAGTLLIPSEPAAEVYLRYGQKYGVNLSEEEILMRFRIAYGTPWADSSLRYVEDGRPFWRFIVQESTGCDNKDLFEEIYQYYARGEAWYVTPGAIESLKRIRARGIKTAIVSNFDSRLRSIMDELKLSELFDNITISCEIGVEKPNPRIFEHAMESLGVSADETVHVGDDRRNDLAGARDAGCYGWLWGSDVKNFAEVERRLETGNMYDSLSF